MSFIDSHITEIFAAIVGAVVAWQLFTGVAVGEWRGARYRRDEHPWAYWRRIGFQAVIFVVVVLTGRTSWEMTWSSRDQKTAVVQQAQRRADTVTAPNTGAQRQRAFALHNAHQYAPAIAVYDSILAAGDSAAWTHLNRGMALWNLGRTDAALEDFRRVMTLDSANLDAPRYADQLLAPQGRWDEIIAIWTDFIRRNPDNADAYYERGGTYFHKGDRAAALSDASRACELGHAGACRQLDRLR